MPERFAVPAIMSIVSAPVSDIAILARSVIRFRCIGLLYAYAPIYRYVHMHIIVKQVLEAVMGKARAGDGVSYPQRNRCNVTALRKATRHVSQFYDTLLAPLGLR